MEYLMKPIAALIYPLIAIAIQSCVTKSDLTLEQRSKLKQVVVSENRSDKARKRDRFRHPNKTLDFFFLPPLVRECSTKRRVPALAVEPERDVFTFTEHAALGIPPKPRLQLWL